MGDSTDCVSQGHPVGEHIQTPEGSFDSVSQNVMDMSSSEDGASLDAGIGSCADSGHGSLLSSLGHGDVKTAWVKVDDDVTCLTSSHQPALCSASWLERCSSDESSRVYTLPDDARVPYYQCAPLPLLPSTDLPLDGTHTCNSAEGYPGCHIFESDVPRESCVQQLTEESASRTEVTIFTVPVHEDHHSDDSCLVEMAVRKLLDVAAGIVCQLLLRFGSSRVLYYVWSNHQTANHQTASNQTATRQPTARQPATRQPLDSQPPDSQQPDSQPPDSQSPDSHPPDRQPPDSH
ncbi:hypothetical protein Btru_069250 [Bulinus truncatus]|nr:hypothetical protein Btru_069250 [Bulinus truncatus]